MSSTVTTSTSSVDSYLADELESHACSICYELMEAPIRSPIILIPCGHTLCKSCVTHHANSSSGAGGGKKRTCALCRQVIESQAVNISLQQLIQSMLAKRSALQKEQHPEADEQRQLQQDLPRYIQQYHQYSLRCAVLHTRLSDLSSDYDTSVSDLTACELVSSHLLQEQSQTRERLKMIQNELELIQQHLVIQTIRQDELKEIQANTLQAQMQTRELLIPLERDRDKVELIIRQIAPEVKLEKVEYESKGRKKMEEKEDVEAEEDHKQQPLRPVDYRALALQDGASTRARVPPAPTTSSTKSKSSPSAASMTPWTFPARPR